MLSGSEFTMLAVVILFFFFFFKVLLWRARKETSDIHRDKKNVGSSSQIKINQ